MQLSDDERRKAYKHVWYQKKQAAKKPGYNATEWDARLDALRVYPNGITPPSRTAAYHRKIVKQGYAADPDRAKYQYYRRAINALLNRSDITIAQIDELLELAEVRGYEFEHND